jgi:hypothetical protein
MAGETRLGIDVEQKLVEQFSIAQSKGMKNPVSETSKVTGVKLAIVKAISGRPDFIHAVRNRTDTALSASAITPEFVLQELKKVYDRCMQVTKVTDRKGAFLGYFEFDARNALEALRRFGEYLKMFTADREGEFGNERALGYKRAVLELFTVMNKDRQVTSAVEKLADSFVEKQTAREAALVLDAEEQVMTEEEKAEKEKAKKVKTEKAETDPDFIDEDDTPDDQDEKGLWD